MVDGANERAHVAITTRAIRWPRAALAGSAIGLARTATINICLIAVFLAVGALIDGAPSGDAVAALTVLVATAVFIKPAVGRARASAINVALVAVEQPGFAVVDRAIVFGRVANARHTIVARRAVVACDAIGTRPAAIHIALIVILDAITALVGRTRGREEIANAALAIGRRKTTVAVFASSGA